MTALHPVVAEVTARIVERSRETRADYLRRMDAARASGAGRAKLSCANWAHAFAGQTIADKLTAMGGKQPNVGVVTAYNDMLSAHQPYEHYPELIRRVAVLNADIPEYAQLRAALRLGIEREDENRTDGIAAMRTGHDDYQSAADDAAPVDMLAALFEARGWPCEMVGEDELLTEVKGSWTSYQLRAIWRHEDNVLQLLAMPDIRVPDDKFAVICEALALINEQLWLGHFDIWSNSER